MRIVEGLRHGAAADPPGLELVWEQALSRADPGQRDTVAEHGENRDDVRWPT